MKTTPPVRTTGSLTRPAVARLAGRWLFLLYSLAAGFDHVMSLAQGATYYRNSGMSESQVAFFTAVPLWAVAGWTLSVWGGLCGSAALLLRRRIIAGLLAVSLAGSAVYMLHAAATSPRAAARAWACQAMPMILRRAGLPCWWAIARGDTGPGLCADEPPSHAATNPLRATFRLQLASTGFCGSARPAARWGPSGRSSPAQARPTKT